MTFTSSLRFLYIFDPSGLLCGGYAMLGEMHYSSWWFLCVEQVEDLTPEKYASAFSQMIFAWVDPLMRAGWKKQLYPADLWSLQVNFSQSDFSKGQLISKSLDVILWHFTFSKKTNERRLTLLRNNSWSQKKQIRLFVFLKNLGLEILLSN